MTRVAVTQTPASGPFEAETAARIEAALDLNCSRASPSREEIAAGVGSLSKGGADPRARPNTLGESS